MKCEVRTITPEEANRLLQNNSINRKIRKLHVQFFEAQLKRGEMLLTHQGIAISENGRLLDGQHRLTAIANTGISAQFLVSYDVPESTFVALDTGAARTAGDVLSVEGIANGNTLAAAIRLCLYYEQIPDFVWVGNIATQVASSTTIKARFYRDQANWELAARIGHANALTGIVTASPMTTLAYLAIAKENFPADFVSYFAANLKQGAALQEGSPILAYRNRAILRTVNTKAQGKLADYIKLFNAFSTGQKLKLFKSQSYPPMPTLVNVCEVVN
jgi:hypothetical protein